MNFFLEIDKVKRIVAMTVSHNRKYLGVIELLYESDFHQVTPQLGNLKRFGFAKDSKSESPSVIEEIVVRKLPHMETWLT